MFSNKPLKLDLVTQTCTGTNLLISIMSSWILLLGIKVKGLRNKHVTLLGWLLFINIKKTLRPVPSTKQHYFVSIRHTASKQNALKTAAVLRQDER